MNYCQLLFLAVVLIESYAIPVDNRIIGGEEVEITKHPYIVALIYRDMGSHFCAGSIITPRTVLTAAHCIATGVGSNIVDADTVDLMTGTTNWDIPGVRHTLKSIHVHANYDYDRSDLDIAVLITKKKMKYNLKTQPIALAPVVPTLPANATVAGWGTTSATGWGPTVYHLRDVEVHLDSDSDCKYAFRNDVDITDDMLCAGYDVDGKDACSGDSGGPLVWYDKNNCNKVYLVGIVSFGKGCAEAIYPGVYVKVPNADITAFVIATMK